MLHNQIKDEEGLYMTEVLEQELQEDQQPQQLPETAEEAAEQVLAVVPLRGMVIFHIRKAIWI